jgi:phosphate starvation-inducible PhoH-like protein
MIGSEETKCISIDHPEKLYLTDNFIVTHNTFDNAICIVDEFQNLNSSQLKMAIGRLGKGSVMLFCGDTDQIDLKVKSESAIHEIQRLNDSKFVSIIELKENHRHAAVKEVLNLLK